LARSGWSASISASSASASRSPPSSPTGGAATTASGACGRRGSCGRSSSRCSPGRRRRPAGAPRGLARRRHRRRHLLLNPLQRSSRTRSGSCSASARCQTIALRTVAGETSMRSGTCPGAAWRPYLRERAAEVAPIFERSGGPGLGGVLPCASPSASRTCGRRSARRAGPSASRTRPPRGGTARAAAGSDPRRPARAAGALVGRNRRARHAVDDVTRVAPRAAGRRSAGSRRRAAAQADPLVLALPLVAAVVARFP
jgi:hypothetical protein